MTLVWVDEVVGAFDPAIDSQLAPCEMPIATHKKSQIIGGLRLFLSVMERVNKPDFEG